MEFKIVRRASQQELDAEVAELSAAGWEALGGVTISAKGLNRDTEYSRVLVRRVKPPPTR
jgi:hypothetical protein